MKKFQKYISCFFIIISFFGFLQTLKNIGMSESQYYGIENDKWTTTIGESIMAIFVFSVLLQSLIYFIIFIYHLILFFKFKDNYSIKVLRIIAIAFLLFIFWLLITILVSNNGHNDVFWGPADTGLFFISLASFFVNYLIFSTSFANTILTPLKLYLYYKDCEE